MPKTKNPRPVKPYCDYTFRVRWDGRLVAGVSRVGALARVVEVVEYREGGDPTSTHKLPGRVGFEPITLERGVTTDGAFDAWARQVGADAAGGARIYKNVRIEVYDAAGRMILAFDVLRCWPSRYAAVTGLDSGSPCCLIESLTLENDGWQRVALRRRR